MTVLRYYLLLLFICIAGHAVSQRVVNVDKDDATALSGLFFSLGGEPFSLDKYVKVVEGSPFFNEEWMEGALLVADGKRYDSIKLKIDLVANEVHYMDGSGKPMIATSQVREIWLTESISNKKYHFVHSSFIGTGGTAAKGWYLLLVDGPAILFKKQQKEIIEAKPYGSAIAEQHIKDVGRFYILHNNTLTPVKTIASVADALPGKKTELLDHIKANKLKGKTDADYIGLVYHYNNLLQK